MKNSFFVVLKLRVVDMSFISQFVCSLVKSFVVDLGDVAMEGFFSCS